MFDKLLKEYCEENEFEIREYSGRYGANGLMGIVIPNGMRSFGIFIHEFTLKLVEAEKELEGREKEIADVELFETWDYFVNSLEFDSMGRDDQVIYSREFNWVEFQKAVEEESDEE